MRLVDRNFQCAQIGKGCGYAFIPAFEIINQRTDSFHIGRNVYLFLASSNYLSQPCKI